MSRTASWRKWLLLSLHQEHGADIAGSGLFVYTILNGLIWVVIWVSGGRIEPREYDLKEYWTWRPAGEKPWVVRAFTKGNMWENRRKPRGDDGIVLEDDNESTFAMRDTRGSATSGSEKSAETLSTPARVMVRPE